MYFKSFPTLGYEFPDGVVRDFKDLSIRPNLVDRYFEEVSALQEYELEDGDTPEIVAYKVYGNVNYHWIVLLSSQRFNIFTEWNKSTSQFNEYLYEKYSTGYDSEGKPVDLTRSEITELLEFTGSTTNGFYGLTDSGAVMKPHHFIDEDKIEYSWDTAQGTNIDSFGRSVILPTLSPVSIYQYEFEENEMSKTILIPKPSTANKINNELKKIVNE